MPAVHLAHGVVLATGEEAWLPWPDGRLVRRAPGGMSAVPSGAAVVIGSRRSPPDQVVAALVTLDRLVDRAGIQAVGAGVDLGGGFRSARLEGAPGDHRDAMLAALRALWPDEAWRLGPRTAVVTALFGARATRRVGAALGSAADDGRWAAVHLASAASDLLGPEQVERLLALPVPDGADPVPGGEASALAGHLAEVLEPLPPRRRLTLLADLWERVTAHGEAHARECEPAHLLPGQDGDEHLEALRRLQRGVQDVWILELVADELGDAGLVEATEWDPPDDSRYYVEGMRRVVADALAATALAEVARAAASTSPGRAIVDHVRLLAASVHPERLGDANQPVLDLLAGPLPAAGRPGHVAARLAVAAVLHADPPPEWEHWGTFWSSTGLLDDCDATFREGQRSVHDLDRLAQNLLAPAYNLGRLALQSASGFLPACPDQQHGITTSAWRRETGRVPTRSPEEWEGPQSRAWRARREGFDGLSSARLAAPPGSADLPECDCDLLWFADLADAVAALRGQASAVIEWHDGVPRADVAEPPPVVVEADPEPLVPPVDSVPGAVAGATQLVRLGATVPPRARSWPELVEGLLAGVAMAEITAGEFKVPEEILGWDLRFLPGTELRVEVATRATQLDRWAHYMGNCIAGYVWQATDGDCVLLALRDGSGRIVANVELRRRQPGSDEGRPWEVSSAAARFNASLPDDLRAALDDWASTLPGPSPPSAATVPAPERRTPPPPVRARAGAAGPRRRQRPGPAVLRARQQLAAAAGARLAAMGEGETLPLREVAALLGGHPGADVARAAVGIHRAAIVRLSKVLAAAFADGLSLAELWVATAARPLATAIDDVEPEVATTLEAATLLQDGPLPAAVRPLARLEPVRQARSVDLAQRRLRAALGQLLRRADSRLDDAVVRDPKADFVGAAMLALTAWGDDASDRVWALLPVEPSGAVAGAPAAQGLEAAAGPWASAWANAPELEAGGSLAAVLGALRARITAGEADSLRLPAAWLGRRGWPAF